GLSRGVGRHQLVDRLVAAGARDAAFLDGLGWRQADALVREELDPIAGCTPAPAAARTAGAAVLRAWIAWTGTRRCPHRAGCGESASAGLPSRYARLAWGMTMEGFMDRARSGGRGLLGTWAKIPSLETLEMLAHAGFDFVVIRLGHAP